MTFKRKMYFQTLKSTTVLKKIPIAVFIMICIGFTACSSKKENPVAVAKKWCELNTKVTKAPDGGPEYGRAKEARERFEKEMEEKYKDDKPFMQEVEKEVEKCEDESESK